MTDQIKDLAGKVRSKLGAAKGDLYVVMPWSKREVSLDDVENVGMQIQSFGLDRFSKVQYFFRGVQVLFQDDSEEIIGLGGLRELAVKDFKALLRSQHAEKLPLHFSLFSGTQFLNERMKVFNIQTLKIEPLHSSGGIKFEYEFKHSALDGESLFYNLWLEITP